MGLIQYRTILMQKVGFSWKAIKSYAEPEGRRNVPFTLIENNNVTFLPEGRLNLNNESGRLFSVSTLHSQRIWISDQSRCLLFLSICKAIGNLASPVLRANSDDLLDDLPENRRRLIASKLIFYRYILSWTANAFFRKGYSIRYASKIFFVAKTAHKLIQTLSYIYIYIYKGKKYNIHLQRSRN